MTPGELKAHADIHEVWSALGGGPLRHNRGQAFWRKGDGPSISLDAQKGVWFDHVVGSGGDAIDLVKTARGCDFRQALMWLSSFTGIPISNTSRATDTDWRADIQKAIWWAITAEVFAEEALKERPEFGGPLPCDDWPELTGLLQAIRMSDASLVDQYREWRRRDPQLTDAMTRAGRQADEHKQERLARWIQENYA